MTTCHTCGLAPATTESGGEPACAACYRAGLVHGCCTGDEMNEEADVAHLGRVAYLALNVERAERIDVRAMLAREVYAEWQCRGHLLRMTPAAFVKLELGGFNARKFVEAECGEPLC